MNEIIQTPTAIGPIPIDVIRVPESGATIDFVLVVLLTVVFYVVLRLIVMFER